MLMRTYNIREAKAHLSQLVDKAAYGESFIIAKAGKPMVKVVAVASPHRKRRKRLGFLSGQIAVPDDFDLMGREEIEALFGH